MKNLELLVFALLILVSACGNPDRDSSYYFRDGLDFNIKNNSSFVIDSLSISTEFFANLNSNTIKVRDSLVIFLDMSNNSVDGDYKLRFK